MERGGGAWMAAALIVSSGLSFLQNTGRFASLTEKALEAIEKGQFNLAVNLLEEVWEADQSDPVVAEHLGLAYLYADRNPNKAKELMEAAIKLGGRASFVMQHAHERLTVISMGTSDYCPGRLSISPDKLTFTAKIPEHSFTIAAGELKEIKKNQWFGRSEAVYHIETLDKRKFNLRPRTWSEGETKLVLYFINKYIRR
jgi:hypothetical protein